MGKTLHLGPYRLLAQTGAGRDGACYRADGPADGEMAVVWVLDAARADPERWKVLHRRLLLAASLEHSATLAVLGQELEHDPPWVALEAADGPSLAAALQSRVPLPGPEAVALARELAGALAEAHRLGTAHGRLRPGGIRTAKGNRPKIDITGIDAALDPPGTAFAGLDEACTAPEVRAGKPGDAAADVFGLGALVSWLLRGIPGAVPAPAGAGRQPSMPTLRELRELDADRAARLDRLLRDMLAAEPADRPSAADVRDRLTALLDPSPHRDAGLTAELSESGEQEPAFEAGGPAGGRLGRFHVLEKLGEGGMGAVYRARDPLDGSVVALKVLRADWARKPASVRRFHKEARLLAEVNNPYVTNLLEVNEEKGVPYLVLEYAAGRSLDKLLEAGTPLDETTAVSILADVARALVEAHERGIIHRDVKPDNILLLDEPADAAARTERSRPRIKLSDFGLARHVVESESLQVTRAGAVLGTPFYMAPEQCSGKPLDVRADVYAMGATLFHLLAGRPPFLGDTPLAVITQHYQAAPPPLRKLNPAVSEAVCQVVEKCLAKTPDLRYADAGALLRDLERLARGEPTSIAVHPRLPSCDTRKLVQYDWSWELEASPEQLWPYVANTDRLNRAVGLPAIDFTARAEPGKGVRRYGKLRRAGVVAAWEEHPFEWIEGRRLGVLREFSQGPFKWLVSVMELAPRAGGGTLLTARVRVEPRNLLGRTVAAVEVGLKGRRGLDRVYRRMDAALTGKLGGRATDPFEEPQTLRGGQRQRLDQLLDRLSRQGIDPAVLERLGDYLGHGPAQEVARIRPLALARRLGLDPEQVVAACLRGAREGLLVLLWDIVCPVCRIPSEIKETLRQVREHGHCEACNLDFELDFANSVELIFRAHPEVRATELGTYCIGGPAHSPHVAAQVRLAPGERMELELSLGPGSYRLRGPQLPIAFDFRVEPAAVPYRLDLDLSHGSAPELPRNLKAGRQLLVLVNDQAHELLVRVERTAGRDDALTAARASSLALFRELFPDEVLSPGQLVSVATITLLTTALDGAGDFYERLGDARAFGLIHEHFRLLEEAVRREGGALIKTVGEGIHAAFSEPVAAVRAALQLQAVLAAGEKTRELRVRVGVHRGPALAATLNDHLDYFGTTVGQAAALPALARGGEVVLTQAVAADPQVAAFLRGRGLEPEVFAGDLPRRQEGLLHRLRPCPVPG